jgi:peptidoglycan/LPS O-acetylase OafA/YrhL
MGTPHSTENDTGRILELDAVRGLAAVAVLLTHLPLGFWFGETGVDLFFVLSGYLITAIILRNREQPGFLKAFYYRRALRIFPIYYLALLIVLGLNLLRSTPAPTGGIEYYFIYLQNIHQYWGQESPKVGLSLGHTWTLAIEEQFYLLWPAAILFLKPRRALWLCLLLVFLPVLLRSQGLDRCTLFGHTDGLALGACLAFIGHYHRRAFSPKTARIYLAILIGALVGYGVLWSIFSGQGMSGKAMIQNNYAILLVSVGYFALVGFLLGIAGTRWAGALRVRPLVWIGTISYGLYLYHWIVYELFDAVFKFGRGYNDPWWLSAIKVVASFAVAAMSWYLLERPLLRLKDLISYRTRQPHPGNPRPALTPPTVRVALAEE